MSHRRSFLKKSIALVGAIRVGTAAQIAKAESVTNALLALKDFSPAEAAEQEELWTTIAQAFTVSPTILNLNNAGASPQPKVVQEALDRYTKMSNELPTYYMTQILHRGAEAVRKKLAELAGASPDEIAIVRNATEALGIVTHGLNLTSGEEIVMCRQDYPSMIHAWAQRSMRDGIKINWLDLPLRARDDQEIIRAFIGATTNKTRIWHITHMINWTGQILPVKKLCDEARSRKIITIVDGAQSFSHLDFKLSDFTPDYFGASLHKWLCGPFGTGMLYVRKENVKNLWPLFPDDQPQRDDIRKFESFGTKSIPHEQAIAQAIDFHNVIGSARKEARLQYLTHYWCEKIRESERVRINISLSPEHSCGIGHFSIEGIEPAKVVSKLMTEHQIHTVPSIVRKISGIRISPQVYTSTKDLERFCDAVKTIAS